MITKTLLQNRRIIHVYKWKIYKKVDLFSQILTVIFFFYIFIFFNLHVRLGEFNWITINGKEEERLKFRVNVAHRTKNRYFFIKHKFYTFSGSYEKNKIKNKFTCKIKIFTQFMIMISPVELCRPVYSFCRIEVNFGFGEKIIDSRLRQCHS